MPDLSPQALGYRQYAETVDRFFGILEDESHFYEAGRQVADIRDMRFELYHPVKTVIWDSLRGEVFDHQLVLHGVRL